MIDSYNLPIFAWGGEHLCVLFLCILREELRFYAIPKVIALCNTKAKIKSAFDFSPWINK